MNDFSFKELQIWIKTPNINPKSKRKIKINGPTYIKLKEAYNKMIKKSNNTKKYQTGTAMILPKNEDRFVLRQNNGYLWASIFDGHSGDQVSTFLSKNILKVFKNVSKKALTMEESLIRTYKILEDSIEHNMLKSGSTGSTCLIHPSEGKIYIAHVGDSRIIAKKSNQAIALTMDHKPNILSEYKRIKLMGGRIKHNGVWRIGSLAVSRVFGDLDIKKNNPSVISTPDISTIDTNDISIIVLASDGLFDVCSNEEILMFVDTNTNKNLNIVAEELALYAMKKGSQDDITILIIKL